MKKLTTILLCSLLGLFCLIATLFGIVSCVGGSSEDTEETVSVETTVMETSGRTDFTDKFYSKEALVMGGNATAEFFKDGTFEMISEFEEQKTKSTVTGTYKKVSKTEITVQPQKQTIVTDGIPQEKDLSTSEAVTATISGDVLVIGVGTSTETTYYRVLDK